MPTAAELINQIIANAITTANDQTAAASDAADDLILRRAGTYFPPSNSETGFTVSATEPAIPSVGDSTDEYDARLAEMVQLLADQLADFFAKYYPLTNDAYDEAVAWLVDTITNGGTGINVTIENQVWQRARDRLIADGRRVQDTIVTGFAAKGYRIPPGAMTHKIEQVLFEQASNSGKASTDIAAKQLEIEIATIKFAVEQAIDSRMRAMNAAADYIRAIASAPDGAVKATSIDADNQAKMVAAYSSWYNTRLERDRIILSSKMAEMASRDDIYKHQGDLATRNDSVDVQALVAAADVFARTASAALASLNSIVSTASNTFA